MPHVTTTTCISSFGQLTNGVRSRVGLGGSTPVLTPQVRGGLFRARLFELGTI